MISPTWVMAGVTLGGVLVTFGVAWNTINRVAAHVEKLDSRVQAHAEDIAALRAYSGLPPRR